MSIQLTRATYSHLCEGIAKSSVPQSFQDAIFITRRLSVRYIWIDCLCIMQDPDDLSDWRREASLMGKVYCLAFCNISAAADLPLSNSISQLRIRSYCDPLRLTSHNLQQNPGNHFQCNYCIQSVGLSIFGRRKPPSLQSIREDGFCKSGF